MSAAAVIRMVQALFGITGLKAHVGGTLSVLWNPYGLTEELQGILAFLRQVGVHGTLGGAVKCVDI